MTGEFPHFPEKVSEVNTYSTTMSHTERVVVLVTGRKRSGKDTLGRHLVERYGFQATLALADAVKRVAREIILGAYGEDVPLENFTLGDVKEQEVGPGLWLAGQPLTPRWAAQWVGQTLGRDLISSNVWIQALFSKILEYDRVVITDARYRNEIEWFREELPKHGYRVVVVKTVDTGFARPAEGASPMTEHPSEREADTNPCDVVISRNMGVTSHESFLCLADSALRELV